MYSVFAYWMFYENLDGGHTIWPNNLKMGNGLVQLIQVRKPFRLWLVDTVFMDEFAITLNM